MMDHRAIKPRTANKIVVVKSGDIGLPVSNPQTVSRITLSCQLARALFHLAQGFPPRGAAGDRIVARRPAKIYFTSLTAFKSSLKAQPRIGPVSRHKSLKLLESALAFENLMARSPGRPQGASAPMSIL
jgi:hypothetical protein